MYEGSLSELAHETAASGVAVDSAAAESAVSLSFSRGDPAFGPARFNALGGSRYYRSATCA